MENETQSWRRKRGVLLTASKVDELKRTDQEYSPRVLFSYTVLVSLRGTESARRTQRCGLLHMTSMCLSSVVTSPCTRLVQLMCDICLDTRTDVCKALRRKTSTCKWKRIYVRLDLEKYRKQQRRELKSRSFFGPLGPGAKFPAIIS